MQAVTALTEADGVGNFGSSNVIPCIAAILERKRRLGAHEEEPFIEHRGEAEEVLFVGAAPVEKNEKRGR